MKKSIAILIGIISGMLLFGQIVCASEIEAVPSTHSLHIRSDGINETIDDVPAYIYEGNNYFKLRDLCKIIGCRVEWNGYNKSAILTEDRTVRDFSALAPIQPVRDVLKKSQIIRGVDNHFVDIDCLNIDGYNYFKLRDLIYAMQFACDWNNDTKTIEIVHFNNFNITEKSQVVKINVPYDPNSADYSHLEKYIQEHFDPKFKAEDYIIEDFTQRKKELNEIYGYPTPGYSIFRFYLNVNGVPTKGFWYEIVCLDGKAAIIEPHGEINPDFDLEKAGGPELSDEDAKRIAVERDRAEDPNLHGGPVFDQEIERYFNMDDLAHYCLVKTRYVYSKNGNDYYSYAQQLLLDHYQRD